MANIVIKTYDKFDDDFVAKWEELYNTGSIYNLSPAWCKLWFENFGKNKKLHIIAIYDKRDNLKLVAPFYRLGKILSLIGTRPIFYDECNILSVDREHMVVLLDYIFENKWDLNLTHVNAQSDFAKTLQRYLCEHKIRYNAFLSETKQIINKEFAPQHGEMKNIRRQKRYVENNMNDVAIFEYDIPKTEKTINELINMHKSIWVKMYAKEPKTQNFFENLFKNFRNVKLSRLALQSNGRTMAYELGIIDSNNKYWFLMCTYDRAFHKVSPGKVLMYDLTQYLLEHGVERLDLGRGCESYKGGYSNEENILIHFNTYNATFFSRLYIRIQNLMEKIAKRLRNMA